MRIVFFGTPLFAAKIFSYLFEKKLNIVAVVTRPDKPRGRSGQNLPSAVKAAVERIAPSLPLLQPEKVSTDEMVRVLEQFSPDLFVVVAYGEILKENILSTPKKGCINVHASLLPKYRGAAPIQRCLMSGDKETGITIIEMVLQMDAGNKLAVSQIPIGEEMTAGELEDALCDAACPLLAGVIADIDQKKIEAAPQNSDEVTFAPKITQADRLIDWRRSAREIHNQIRALSPEPGAYSQIKIGEETRRLIIRKSHSIENLNEAPGLIIPNSKWGLVIGCGTGALALLEVQLEGKKSLKTGEFMRGVQGKSIKLIQ